MDNLLVCYKTSQIKSTRQQHIPTSFCCSCQNFTAFDVVGLQNCYSFCFGPGLLLPPPLSRLNLQWYTYNKQPFYIYVYPVIPATYSEKEQHNTNISNPPPNAHWAVSSVSVLFTVGVTHHLCLSICQPLRIIS